LAGRQYRTVLKKGSTQDRRQFTCMYTLYWMESNARSTGLIHLPGDLRGRTGQYRGSTGTVQEQYRGSTGTVQEHGRRDYPSQALSSRCYK
jgi:hypothetical protein